jgi:hypothetical protein
MYWNASVIDNFIRQRAKTPMNIHEKINQPENIKLEFKQSLLIDIQAKMSSIALIHILFLICEHV